MSWTLLQNSLWLGLLVTGLATTLGLCVALAASGLSCRWRLTLFIAAGGVLALPPFLVTNCWMALLGHTGVLRPWLPFPLYSFAGAVALLTLMLWPVTTFTVLAAWRRVDASLLDAEPALQGGTLFRKLLLPAARPVLAPSCALTFVLALNHFTVPVLLQVRVLPAEVWLRFNTHLDATGALLAGLPLIIAPLLLLLWLWRREVNWPRTEGGALGRTLRSRLGGLWRAAFLATVALLTLSLLLPLGHLLMAPQTWTALGPAGATGGTAAGASLRYALPAATLVIVAGTLGRNLRVARLSWLTLLTPGILLGLVLLLALNRPPFLGFTRGPGIVVLALMLRYLALGYAGARLAAQACDLDLVDAARLEGASRWQLWWQARWPQMAPQLLAAWYVVFLLSLWDIETIVLLTPPGGETLPMVVFNLLHYGHNAQVNALCLGLLLLAALPAALWLAGRMLWQLARKWPPPPGGRDQNRLGPAASGVRPSPAAAASESPRVPVASHAAGSCAGCRVRGRPHPADAAHPLSISPPPGLAIAFSLTVLLTGAGLTTGCGNPSDKPALALDSRFFSAVEVIGKRGRGPGEFNKPRSLAVDSADNLYVVDLTGRVQKFDAHGDYLLAWQMPETELGRPKGMAFDSEGNLIVVEPHYARVNHFRPDGTLVRQWGERGTNNSQINFPRAVAVGSGGEIWVSEYAKAERVQRFSADGGTWWATIGRAGDGPGEFNRAEGICVDQQDRLHVADSCNHRIQIFAPDGDLVRMFGRAGSGPGELSYPYDIRVDADGTQFVCEFGNSRIQVFDAGGRSVETIGGPGAAPGQFSNPWSLALDSAGNLYVADAANHRVQKLLRRTGTHERQTRTAAAPASAFTAQLEP